MFITLAKIVAYIGYFVLDNPSENLFNASKIISGIIDRAIKFRYGIANLTTSSG